MEIKPAGVEMFDISKPEEPRSIGFFDSSGPHSRGVHQVWFVDGEYVIADQLANRDPGELAFVHGAKREHV